MDLPKRKRIRLRGYDYSQSGAYFITICTKDKACLLGNIVGQGLCSCRLTPIGEIVRNEIINISARFTDVFVDRYVIMPNHIHMILILDGEQQTQGRQEQSPCPTTVGDVVCAMKSLSAKAANKAGQVPGGKLWQFRFHDHIIRNEDEYQKICQYIDENPMKWQQDCFYGS